jgi:hypothetical protein
VTGWRAKMLLGSGLWMRSPKMVEYVEKDQNMLLEGKNAEGDHAGARDDAQSNNDQS